MVARPTERRLLPGRAGYAGRPLQQRRELERRFCIAVDTPRIAAGRAGGDVRRAPRWLVFLARLRCAGALVAARFSMSLALWGRRNFSIHSAEYMVPRQLVAPQWQGAGSSSS